MAKRAGEYAFFSGTGPADKTCLSCDHCTAIDKSHQNFYCSKAREFVGLDKPTRRISTSMPSCKYWTERAVRNTVIPPTPDEE